MDENLIYTSLAIIGNWTLSQMVPFLIAGHILCPIMCGCVIGEVVGEKTLTWPVCGWKRRACKI